jgi:hypothetical protein
MINTIAGMAGVFIALLAIYIGQRRGFWQFTLATKAHGLNIARSRPKIGTEVRIEDEFQEYGAINIPPSHYLRITIYNAGELAATQLNGYCKLSSPNDTIQEFTIPIIREFLDSARPYDLEPCKVRWTKGYWKQTELNVNIEFDYFGLPSDEPEHYSASYHLDHQRNYFVRD